MQNGLIRRLLSVDQLTEEVLAPAASGPLTLLAMLTATPLRAYSAEHWIRRHNARTLPAERVFLEQLRDVLGYADPFEEQLLGPARARARRGPRGRRPPGRRGLRLRRRRGPRRGSPR